ncbi:MAG: choice-of-anchor A family protein, partial [Desulfovibrionaceae bacterium]
DLTLGGVAVWGSILAVNADVTAESGVIWGTTIASSWTGAMQQNHNPFTGDIPATPIPGSVWLLGSGMLGLVGLNRLRRQ